MSQPGIFPCVGDVFVELGSFVPASTCADADPPKLLELEALTSTVMGGFGPVCHAGAGAGAAGEGRWVVGAPSVEDTQCLVQVPADCTVWWYCGGYCGAG